MSEFEHDVAMRVNGQDFAKWTGVTVSRSMDAVCSEFMFSSTSESELDVDVYPFKMEDECQVVANGEVLVTGYIDTMAPAYDSGGHSIEVGGRSLTADLVDCTRAGDANSWQNLSVRAIVSKLCAPHGLTLIVDSSVNSEASQKEPWFSYNEGEKVVETLRRLCAPRGIVPLTDTEGRLILTKLSGNRATDVLESGVNVKAARHTAINRDRYSDYYAKGIGLGLPTKTTKDYIQPKGDARDPMVGRFRPFTIINDAASTFGGCSDRAKWEAALRAGKSRMYEYEVRGWLQSDGTPWNTNTLVRVRDKAFNLDTELLIYAVQNTVEPRQGTKSILYLCSEEKYKAEAQLNKTAGPMDSIFAAVAGGGE